MATVGEIAVVMTLKNRDFIRGLEDAQRGTLDFNRGVTRLSGVLAGALVNAFAAATAAVSALGVAVAKTGAEFEYEMTQVAAISQSTASELDALTDESRRLGETTMFTAREAASGMVELAKTGLSTGEILGVTSDVLNFAGANMSDLAKAAKFTSATMSQFNLTSQDSTRIVDVFTAANQNSLFDMQSLQTAMRYGGSVAGALGRSLEETTAALGMFRNLGLEGSTAGVRFRQAMLSLIGPTGRAKDVLEKYGLTVRDVNPEVNSFKDIMITLGKTGMDVGEMALLVSKRAAADVQQVSKALADAPAGAITEYDKLYDSLINSAGTAEETYAKFTDTVKGQTTILKSSLQELFLTLFDGFSGNLKEFIRSIRESVQDVIFAFRALSFVINEQFTETFGKIDDTFGLTSSNIESLAINLVVVVNRVIRKFVELITSVDEAYNFLVRLFTASVLYIGITKLTSLIVYLIGAFGSLKAAYIAATTVAGSFAATQASINAVLLGTSNTLTMVQGHALRTQGALAGLAAATNAAKVAFLGLSAAGKTTLIGALIAIGTGIAALMGAFEEATDEIDDYTLALKRAAAARAAWEGKKISQQAESEVIAARTQTIRLLGRLREETDLVAGAQEKRLETIIKLDNATASSLLKQGKLVVATVKISKEIQKASDATATYKNVLIDLPLAAQLAKKGLIDFGKRTGYEAERSKKVLENLIKTQNLSATSTVELQRAGDNLAKSAQGVDPTGAAVLNLAALKQRKEDIAEIIGSLEYYRKLFKETDGDVESTLEKSAAATKRYNDALARSNKYFRKMMDAGLVTQEQYDKLVIKSYKTTTTYAGRVKELTDALAPLKIEQQNVENAIVGNIASITEADIAYRKVAKSAKSFKINLNDVGDEAKKTKDKIELATENLDELDKIYQSIMDKKFSLDFQLSGDNFDTRNIIKNIQNLGTVYSGAVLDLQNYNSELAEQRKKGNIDFEKFTSEQAEIGLKWREAYKKFGLGIQEDLSNFSKEVKIQYKDYVESITSATNSTETEIQKEQRLYDERLTFIRKFFLDYNRTSQAQIIASQKAIQDARDADIKAIEDRGLDQAEERKAIAIAEKDYQEARTKLQTMFLSESQRILQEGLNAEKFLLKVNKDAKLKIQEKYQEDSLKDLHDYQLSRQENFIADLRMEKYHALQKARIDGANKQTLENIDTKYRLQIQDAQDRFYNENLGSELEYFNNRQKFLDKANNSIFSSVKSFYERRATFEENSISQLSQFKKEIEEFEKIEKPAISDFTTIDEDGVSVLTELGALAYKQAIETYKIRKEYLLKYQEDRKRILVTEYKNDVEQGIVAVTTAGARALDTLLNKPEKVNAALGGFFSKFGKGIQNVFDRIGMEAFLFADGPLEYIGNRFMDVPKNLSKGMEGFKKSVSSVAADPTGFIAIILAIVEITKLIAKAAKAMIDKFFNAIKNTANKLKEFGESIFDYITGGLTLNPLQLLTDGVNELIQTLEQQNSELENLTDNQQKLADVQKQFDEGLISAEEMAEAQRMFGGSGSGGVKSTADILSDFVDGLINKAIQFLETLVASAPRILRGFIRGIPRVFRAIAKELPKLIATLAKELPNIVIELIDGLIIAIPDIIDALIEALPRLAERLLFILTDKIPQFLTVLAAKLPELFRVIAEIIPKLAPQIRELIKLGFQIFAKLLPDIAPILFQLEMEKIKFNLQALGLMTSYYIKIGSEMAVEFLKGVGKFFRDLLQEIFTVGFAETETFGDTPGVIRAGTDGLSAQFAAGDYIVAAQEPMDLLRMAASGLSENISGALGRVAAPKPVLGLEGAMSGGGQSAPIDIAVVAEGRVLTNVQINAMNRGHAPKMEEKFRRTSGAKVGFDRGRFAKYGA